MPSLASYTESRSSQGSRPKQWLPLLVLTALASLGIASIIGLSLSAVAFSNTVDLRKPGHGIAHSFVMFASMLSFLYILLHILAARTGARLYFDPPIPSFRHQLHAWTTIVIRIVVAMWASANVAVAVGIYRGGGGRNTIHLNADMFACATGFLSTCTLLFVVQLAHRPFNLPWLSPPAAFDEEVSPTREFDDKTSGITRASSSTDRTLDGSPVSHRSKGGGGGKTSSTSTSLSDRSRTRNMARTRRYILDAPTPMALSPVKRQRAGGAGGSFLGEGRDGARIERGLVPSASESESFFAAAAGASVSGSVKVKKGGGGGEMGRRPGTPETVVYVGLPRRPGKVAVSVGGGAGNRRVMSRPLGPRGMKKGGGHLGSDGGGGDAGRSGTAEGVGDAVPPPPPPPPPVQAYTVPGAWMPHLHCDEGVVGYI